MTPAYQACPLILEPPPPMTEGVQLMAIANALSSGAVTFGATAVGELTGNKEDGVGKKIEDFDRSWRRNVRLPSTVNRSCYLGNFHAGRDRLGKRWESCAPEHVMSAPRELLSHASSMEPYSPTASFLILPRGRE